MAGQTGNRTQKTQIDATASEAALEAFLNKTGLADAEPAPPIQDTSVRRFTRLSKDGQSWILVEARPPLEDTGGYVLMAQKLEKIGLRVPAIYHHDPEKGFLIIEDFGDERIYERVMRGEDPQTFYEAAVDVSIALNQADPAVALEGASSYTDAYWLFRVMTAADHYWPRATGAEMPSDDRQEFEALWRDQLLPQVHTLPEVLLHGDFEAQNLYYFPEAEGLARCGLIDFQDLTDGRSNAKGSPAFDLVFLLQHVRLDLPRELEERMKAKFLSATGYDTEIFEREYAIIGAAQATKCLGLFSRLGFVEGRTEYLPYLAYCWRNLDRAFENPMLADLKTFFEARIPEDKRIPPGA